jgi:hypothetical protein
MEMKLLELIPYMLVVFRSWNISTFSNATPPPFPSSLEQVSLEAKNTYGAKSTMI